MSKFKRAVFTALTIQEDQVYFWRKAGKALKSPRKPEKVQKMWPDTAKCHFGVTERLKKFCRKPEKADFFGGKPETDPYSWPSYNHGRHPVLMIVKDISSVVMSKLVKYGCFLRDGCIFFVTRGG